MCPQILLIGHNGQVGWELRRTLAPFCRLTSIDFPDINLADVASIRARVQELRPAVIINAAAYTAVDKAESEPELAMKINGEAPGVLAEEAAKLGALLVHFSTDYIFDGSRNMPYGENDAPNPLSAYGRSKLQGDEAIRRVGGPHLIFRLCWVYGARGQNFLLTISRLAREREKLRVVADQLGCPTWSRMIAEAVGQALRQVIGSAAPESYYGTYNLCAAGQTSWHGFASSIVGRLNPEKNKCKVIDAITTPEYPLPAKRPAYSVLNCDKLANVFGIRLPNWEESLDLVMEELNR